MTLYKLLTNIEDLTELSVFAWSAKRSIHLIASGTTLALFETLSVYLLECNITNIHKIENHVLCTLKSFIDRVE